MIDLTLTPKDYEGFWVARAADDPDHLTIFSCKPTKNGYWGVWNYKCNEHAWTIDPSLFPEVTWDTGAKEVDPLWLMDAGYDRQVRDTKLFRTPEWRNHTEGGLLGFFEKYGRKN